MIQKLKIKVKETIEEKRPLNDTEILIYDVYQMTQEIYIRENIGKFWKSQGFLYSLYDGNEGTFNHPVIRTATPDEFDAWYIRERVGKYGEMSYPLSMYIESCAILKDKQIILELEESEPQLKKNSPVVDVNWRVK